MYVILSVCTVVFVCRLTYAMYRQWRQISLRAQINQIKSKSNACKQNEHSAKISMLFRLTKFARQNHSWCRHFIRSRFLVTEETCIFKKNIVRNCFTSAEGRNWEKRSGTRSYCRGSGSNSDTPPTGKTRKIRAINQITSLWTETMKYRQMKTQMKPWEINYISKYLAVVLASFSLCAILLH